ncbi:MAG: MFS transporter [Deltaproteobacteria bacterium]
MKANTLKLCLPVIAITMQNNVSWLLISPYLQHLQYPVAAIGSLISLSPLLSLVSRIPSGIAYKQSRARLLITIAVVVMGVCSYFYSFAVNALSFAVVHGINGLAYGAATTLYMAYYVDSLGRDENRSHAMGYYVGGLAVGYSAGNFLAGYLADDFGYEVAFSVAALLSLVPLAFVWTLGGAAHETPATTRPPRPQLRLSDSLKAVFDPGMLEVMIVALFLNFINQVAGVFLPLYGLAIGLTLTQVGVIRGLYTVCNAVTRPLSGFVVTRFGHRRLSRGGLALQSALLMLVPLCGNFVTLLAVSTGSGFMRAVAIVGNAVGLIEDVDETKVQRGVASGIYNAAGDLGNIIGPTAGGMVAAFTGLAGLFALTPLVSTLLFFFVLWRLTPRSQSKQNAST